MEQKARVITLTFTEYEQYPDHAFNDEICLHTSDDRWITSEEMENEYLSPALRETFERMKPGETLRILFQILPPQPNA